MEKKETIKSVSFIISGALLQSLNRIGADWVTSILALFGIAIFLQGLNKLAQGLDKSGKKGVRLLISSMLVIIAGIIVAFIPYVGSIYFVVFIIAYMIELFGLIRLKESSSIGATGREGITLLMIVVVLSIIQTLTVFIPYVGGIFGSISKIVSILLIFWGWIKILDGIIDNTHSNN
jgi:hypothetical protein